MLCLPRTGVTRIRRSRRQQEKKMASIELDLPRTAARGDDYVARAQALAPLLKDAADEIEAERQLPPRVVEALIAGGFFKLLIPRSLGGAELHPLSYVQVLETLARAEPSTAWSLGQNSGCSMTAAYLEPEIAREIFGPRQGILAWVRTCPAPGAVWRSAAAFASPGGGGLPPAAVMPLGSAPMCRCSKRMAAPAFSPMADPMSVPCCSRNRRPRSSTTGM